MPARPFAPTNVIRQDIELLDNLKASGNIALYEEARAAVFDKYPEPTPIDATICLLYTSDAADE